jgi:hypothetical protein
LHENIDEQTAFRIEKELIAKYKRKDLYLEEGLLYNKSNGGGGVFRNHSVSETNGKVFSHKKWVLLENKNKTVKQFKEEK